MVFPERLTHLGGGHEVPWQPHESWRVWDIDSVVWTKFQGTQKCDCLTQGTKKLPHLSRFPRLENPEFRSPMEKMEITLNF